MEVAGSPPARWRAAVRRSCSSPSQRPSRISATGRRGMPSLSKGRPTEPACPTSSTRRSAGSKSGAPGSANDWPSCTALALNPSARKTSVSATHSGNSTTGYSPGGTSRAPRDSAQRRAGPGAGRPGAGRHVGEPRRGHVAVPRRRVAAFGGGQEDAVDGGARPAAGDPPAPGRGHGRGRRQRVAVAGAVLAAGALRQERGHRRRPLGGRGRGHRLVPPLDRARHRVVDGDHVTPGHAGPAGVDRAHPGRVHGPAGEVQKPVPVGAVRRTRVATRRPTATLSVTVTTSVSTFWWMRELAKRVSAWWYPPTWTCASTSPGAATDVSPRADSARSATSARCSGSTARSMLISNTWR